MFPFQTLPISIDKEMQKISNKCNGQHVLNYVTKRMIYKIKKKNNGLQAQPRLTEYGFKKEKREIRNIIISYLHVYLVS